jgi:ribosomal protein S18
VKCDEIQARLSDWVDEALTDRAGIDDHLTGCSSCRRLADDLVLLRDVTARLHERPEQTVHHIDEKAAVDRGWQRLHESLKAASARAAKTDSAKPERAVTGVRRMLWFALPGLVAALMLLAWLPGWLDQSAPLDSRRHELRGQANFELKRLEAQQKRALAALTKLVDSQRKAWPKGLAARVAKHQALLDKAIGECRQAARQSPNDVARRAELAAAYRSKIELLRTLVAINDDGGE